MGNQDTRTAAIGSLLSFGLLFGFFVARGVEFPSDLVSAAVLAALVFLFLFGTQDRAETLKPRRAARIFALGIPPLLVALPLLGAWYAICELVRLESAMATDCTLPTFAVLWAAGWVAYARWAGARGGPAIRLKGILLVGVACLLVVLVCWPIHSVTSRRNEFLAGLGAGIGLAIGTLGMYWALSVLLISRFAANRAHEGTAAAP